MIPIPKSYDELVKMYGPVFKAMNIDITTPNGIEKALRTYLGIDITSNKSIRSFISDTISTSLHKLIDSADVKFAEKLSYLAQTAISNVLKDPENQDKILELLIKLDSKKTNTTDVSSEIDEKC